MAPIDAAAVASVHPVPFTGMGFRHLAPSYDPLSGEGARIHGGRFNPPDSFSVLYVCLSRECAVAELLRRGDREVVGAAGFLPRRLYAFRIDLARVLDLCDRPVREHLGIGAADLIGDDVGPTREIGVAAYGLSLQAVRSPSAAGVGDVLAVFPQHIGTSTFEPSLAEDWTSLEQLQT